MKNTKILLMLSMFVILMTVFGNAFAQDANLPAFRISNVIPDQEMVLSTRNFPADTDFVISMAAEDTPEAYVKVSKFNSSSGGNLNVRVKIGEKFRGLNTIYIMLQDNNGAIYRGMAINIPEEEPVVEEPAAEEPAAEKPAEDEQISLVNQEPKEEEKPVEPDTDEAISTETSETAAAEEPKSEETTEEGAAEKPAEDEAITLVNQEPKAEETVEEPAAAEPESTEAVDTAVAAEPEADETVKTTSVEEPAAAAATVQEIPVLVCDFTKIPTVTINSVVRNESVTFTTADFPADSTFTVSMGYYVETWTPSRQPAPHHHGHHHHDPRPLPYDGDPAFYVIGPIDSKPAPSFKPIPEGPKEHAPRGYVTSSFTGTAVGTFETGDGAPQTLTFSIPESMKNVNPIALWISDNGPCGFYSYNYFYNNSTN